MTTQKSIEVPVVRLEQRGLVLYQGRIKARDLLSTWDVKHFKEEYLRPGALPYGYQREVEERAREISTYVKECQIPLVPSLLLGVKGHKFQEFERGFGVLKIPTEEKAINVIDGQHRAFGFYWIQQSLNEEKRLFPTTGRGQEKKLADNQLSELEKLLDFELPATFIDSEVAADIATKRIDVSVLERETGKTKLEVDDTERIFFFVVNRTQKGIKPGLKEVLMYYIASAGIKGIPVIEREKWKTGAVPLVRDLHFDKDSPLYGLINLIGRRGAQEPVKLATFVRSLEPLVDGNSDFVGLAYEKRLQFLKDYWATLRYMYKEAFEKNQVKDYLVLRGIHSRALNTLANDIFNWCWEDEHKVPSSKEIGEYLKPLKDFVWHREKSPVAAYGGYKGATEVYVVLLKKLHSAGITKATKRLQDLHRLDR